MGEADVRRHLARQTGLRLGLIDLLDLKAGRGPERLAAERAQGGIVALDVIDAETLAAAGDLGEVPPDVGLPGGGAGDDGRRRADPGRLRRQPLWLHRRYEVRGGVGRAQQAGWCVVVRAR